MSRWATYKLFVVAPLLKTPFLGGCGGAPVQSWYLGAQKEDQEFWG